MTGNETPMRRIGWLGSAGVTIATVLAAVATVLFIVPWAPAMPQPGLDQSWSYAINEAVARHLIFGRDFVFTFGPLGAVYSGLYHPATDTLMIAGSALLAFGLCAGVAMLVWPRKAYLLLLPVVVAESSVHDNFLMALPLLLLFVTFRLSTYRETRLFLPLSGATYAGVALLSCAVGILPLIKGTLVAVALVNGGLAVLTAIAGRQRMLAVYITAISGLSLCTGWCVAGQPITALPQYFWALEPIVSGYSQAMSFHGPFRDLVFWGLATTVITIIFYASVLRGLGLAGLFVFLGFLFYSFVIFKEGFVRHDGHQLLAAESFLYVGLFLLPFLAPWPAAATVLVACLGWVSIERSTQHFSVSTAAARIEDMALGTAKNMAWRLGSSDRLLAAFTDANAAIRNESPLPDVQGTVDLYSNDLSLLFARGMAWDGRPVIQSYAAFTPALAALNASHLVESNAPQNIFFSVEPIDGRFPSLEDAASWPLLLGQYSIVGIYGDYLHMIRSNHVASRLSEPPATEVTAAVNEWIDLPFDGRLTWVEIGMHPTLLGRAMLMAYKLPQVYIELKLVNGLTIKKRYIPEMGESGFLLSPYVGSTVDFAKMAAGLDRDQRVRQIRIDSPGMGLWPKHISLSFRELSIPRQQNVRKLLLVGPSSPPASILASKSGTKEDCEIDYVDYRPFRALKSPIAEEQNANVAGWTAPSGSRGIGPDETWISLSAADGEQRFYRANTMPRPDVPAYFKQPQMKEPGFSADLDLLGLSGIQELTVYSLLGNEAFRCGVGAVLDVQPDASLPFGSAAH